MAMASRAETLAPQIEAVAAAGPPTLIAAGGSVLAVASGGLVQVISSPTAPALLKADSTGKLIASLAVTRDGQWIAAGHRGAKPALFVWCAHPRAAPSLQGEAITRSSAAWHKPAVDIARAQHSFGISALAFSRSGRLLASHGADRDHQLVIWSPASGKQLGRARTKESYDAVTFAAEDSVACINNRNLAVWSLERCITPGGTALKLTCRSWDLPAFPAPTRFVDLAAAVPATGSAAQMQAPLIAATNHGRLMRLRVGAPTLDKTVEVKERRGGQLSCLAVSGEHITVGTTTGAIALFSASALELLQVLPTEAARSEGKATCTGPIPSCAFTAAGGTLVAVTGGGSRLTAWDLRTSEPPASQLLAQAHSAAIADAILLPGQSPGSSRLATCSVDGCMQLWDLCSSSTLQLNSSLDMRAALPSSSIKLLCLAATQDGRLLAAGSAAGCVHLVSLTEELPASAPALALLGIQLVHSEDVTALCFAVPSQAPSASCQQVALPFLAAGSRRGLVKVLHIQPDGTCTLVASLAQHKSAVTGLALAAGGSVLASADREGRRLLHQLDAATGRMQVLAEVAMPRCSFVRGLAQALGGQALVAASKAGRVFTWDIAGRDHSARQLLMKSGQGELACFAVDEELALLCAATTRGQLLVYNLPSGRLLAAGRAAHVAATAVNKVLMSPAGLVSVGDDASVCLYRWPEGVMTPNRSAGQGTSSEMAPVACSGGGAEQSFTSASSILQPRDLSATIEEEASSMPDAPVAAAAVEEPTAAAPAASAVATEIASQPPCSIPPSPNRKTLLGSQQDRQQQLEQLGQLQSQFAVVTQQLTLRSSQRAARDREAQEARPTAAPPPAAQLALVQYAPPGSPAFFLGSPFQSVSSISLGDLSCSPALRSPDVFSDVGEPLSCASMALPATSTLSPMAGAAVGAACPAGMVLGSSSTGAEVSAADVPKRNPQTASLRRLVARRQASGLLRSPSPLASGMLSTTMASPSPRLGNDGQFTQQAELALWAPTAAAAGLATVPLEQAYEVSQCSPPAQGSATFHLGRQPSPPGSTSVNQPSTRHKWGPVPVSSAGLSRRPLSALPLGRFNTSDNERAPAPEQRSRPALGPEAPPATEDFSVCGDSSAGEATPHSRGSGGTGSGATSRRLSFSFGGPPAAKHPDDQGEDTPPLPGQPLDKGNTSKGAASPPPVLDLAHYHSPGMAGSPVPAQAEADSQGTTPRIFLFGASSGAATTVRAAARHDLAPSCPAVPGSAVSVAGIPQGKGQHGWRGRAAVPRLNLAALGSNGAAVATLDGSGPASSASKRSRPDREGMANGNVQGESGTSSSVVASICSQSLSGSSIAAAACPAACAPAAAKPEAPGARSPASKKSKAGAPSPPHLVIDCQVYSPAQASSSAATLATSRSTAKDQFCRPASHDPLAEPTPVSVQSAAAEPRPAAELQNPLFGTLKSPSLLPSPFIPASNSLASGPEEPPIARQNPAYGAESTRSAPALSQAEDASSDASRCASADTASLTPCAVLALLKQGLQGVLGLQQAGTSAELGVCYQSELRSIAAQLLATADMLATAPAAKGGPDADSDSHAGVAQPTPCSKLLPVAARQHSSACGSHSAMDLAALQADIMAQLKRELLAELRKSA